jgi:pimeloyl-ACP methyl ester carboxylesterase
MRALYDKLPASMKGGQQPSAEESRTFRGYRDFQTRMLGFAFPESELRNIFETNADGTRGRYRTASTISAQVGDGQKKRDYTGIRVPILAFFAGEPPVHPPADADERAAIDAYQTAKTAFTKRWRAQMRRAHGPVRIVDLPDASHFVFFTREADVLRELRAFLKML